jgi:tetratricopeptide (TPR) repeat protein
MLRHLSLTLAIAALQPAPALAQAAATAPPTAAQLATRAAADSAIVHRNWKELVRVYTPVTRDEPQNGLAWFRLGAGLAELGQLEAATKAFEQAIQLKFQPAQAEWRLARVLARRKMLDSVPAHLERATTAGLPVELITNEGDLDPVRKDPRYVALISRLEQVRYPCRSMPEARQFDFWIGDWDVTAWTGATVTLGNHGVNHIAAELEHCIIHERWTSATGSKGESINFWDPNRRAWRQIWMDEGQWSLDYEGEYKDGAMRFNGWSRGPNGQRRLEKLTFFNISRDTVRQTFEQSTDSGKTWQTTFDGRYVRMKSP